MDYDGVKELYCFIMGEPFLQLPYDIVLLIYLFIFGSKLYDSSSVLGS